MQQERSRLPLHRQKSAEYKRLVRFRAQDYLFVNHGIQIEQLNLVLSLFEESKEDFTESDSKSGSNLSLQINVDSESGGQDDDYIAILDEINQMSKPPTSPKHMKEAMFSIAKQQVDGN